MPEADKETNNINVLKGGGVKGKVLLVLAVR